MKEATNFGIKYLQTMPDGHQEYVMHKIIWCSKESAERALEVLRDTVPFPELVEIWDPNEAKCLQDCPGTGNLKAEESLPELDLKKDMHRSIFKSNPDGTVDVEIDGQKITDPEKQKEAEKCLDHIFDHILDEWPWFRDLNKRGIDPPTERKPISEPWDPNQFPYPGWPIWLYDPRQAPWYSTSTGTGDNLRPANNITVG